MQCLCGLVSRRNKPPVKPETKNRLLAVGALAVAGIALAVISAGKIGDNLVYYFTPAELVAKGEQAYGPTIRLGGVVKKGTIEWNPEHTKLRFAVANDLTENATTVNVASEQIPPQMFREGIGVVVEGTYNASHVFQTKRLMVNHSNEYRAPKPGDDTKEWMKRAIEADAETSTAATKP